MQNEEVYFHKLAEFEDIIIELGVDQVVNDLPSRIRDALYIALLKRFKGEGA